MLSSENIEKMRTKKPKEDTHIDDVCVSGGINVNVCWW